MTDGSTIYAHSSGRPPAAIAVVRISGPTAHEAGRRLAGWLPEPRTVAVRKLRDAQGQLLDEALLLRFDAPASATGEDLVELHCHGSRAVVDAVLAALSKMEGLREAQPGEFTRRAFENGRIDLTEAEGLAELLEAETESQRRSALAVAEGGLRRQIEAWQRRLIELSAEAELEIDYVDDHDEARHPSLYRSCAALAEELGEWLRRPRVEPLRNGLRVVVAGPPNAGKSSLVNAIAGTERAIVTAVPGTTRDHIDVSLSLGGIPILLTDTAGLRETPDPVERIGVERANALAEAADILLWLGEPEDAPTHPELIRIHARCDLPGRADAPDGVLAVSSSTSRGIAALLDRIGERARRLLPAPDAIALNRRQAEALSEAHLALEAAVAVADPLLAAENLRSARAAFDCLTGRAGVEDLLDVLFGRFCLGK
ncbi:MAG TPA: tRNA uridine-5-carboxymethylaminomethyl(34) synthesis GTPase MnmE [Sphingomicrobium sp.]|nr:tRNA uridine-5-carboxymethylaminomethyl(34) synthesis GTPase MnmE [Sphingomicrobium sp.]